MTSKPPPPPRKQRSGAQHRKEAKLKALGLPLDAALPPRVLERVDFSACYRVEASAAEVAAEAIAIHRQALRECVETTDPVKAAHCERIARIAAPLVKAADLKRQLDDLGADFRDALKTIKELRDRVKPNAVTPGTAEGLPPVAQH